MNNMYCIGKLAGPVGLKGEIKVVSDSNHQDKIFKIGMAIYIESKKYIIKTSRLFKNNYIISFEDYEDINKINHLLHHDIYINKEDLHLDNNEYLYAELLTCKVIDNDEELGNVDEILISKNSFLIKCHNLIIPMIDNYLDYIDLEHKIIYVKNSKELKI